MKALGFIALLIIIIGGLYSFLDSRGWIGGLRGTDWEKTGYLVLDLPGLKLGTPYLSYEQAGAPALYSELKFDKKSVCEMNGQRTECEISTFAGKMVNVEGKNNEGTILINKLEYGGQKNETSL